ncbi:MAG: ABC transporter ATP-binding protein [Pseudomonadota bacterium]
MSAPRDPHAPQEGRPAPQPGPTQAMVREPSPATGAVRDDARATQAAETAAKAKRPANWPLLRRFAQTWIAPRWKAIAITIAFTSALAAIGGLYPLIIKFAFDELMAKQDMNVLTPLIIAIVGATMLRATFMYAAAITSNRVIMRLGVDLQRFAFAHLMKADFARFGREAPGKLLSRLTNDIAVIQLACGAALTSALRDILTAIALVITMIYLDWAMTLVVLCIYPIAAWPINVVGQQLRKVTTRTQEERANLTAALAETLAGARLIKTFGLERFSRDRLNGGFERVYDLQMKGVFHRARLDPILEALGGAAIAAVIAFAFWRISQGTKTVGDFMGFTSALLMAAQPVRGLGRLNARINEGLAALERVYALLDEKPKIASKPGAPALHITSARVGFEDVTFAYGEHAPAVRGLTLEAAGGKTLALVGASGAGKSTIINLVPRLFDVSAGRITIDDQDIRDVNLESLRASISTVSQDVTLFDDTIRANIAFGKLNATDDEIEAAARAAAAHRFIEAQPAGYGTIIGDRGMRLSGGQRQRIALARAILKDAPILLLDEATSALDTESEQLVQDALARFTRNRTTIVVAHRLSTVQNADLIGVMEAGEIVEQGTHASLIQSDGRYRALCQTQLIDTQEADAAE